MPKGTELQNQQQTKGDEQFLVRILPEQEKQQCQQQKVAGIHLLKMKLVQKVAQKAGQSNK